MTLLPRRPSMSLGITAVLAVAMMVASAATSTAATTPPAPTQAAPTPAAGVVHTVAKASQADTAAYWTPARMGSATPVTAQPDAAAASTPPPGIPNPTYFNGVPAVGALFFTTGSQAHFCTASAVDSSVHDLVLTAAHCVYGSGYATNIAYVPQWHAGISPYGVWPVQTITVAAGWMQSHNQDLDFAFLAVTPPAGTSHPIQVVTGGLRLGINVGYAHSIYVIGYNDTDSQPIGCATTSFEFEPTQIQFYCNNYWDGTSGGPWILHFNHVTGRGTVFGVIGGYEQGGDVSWSSYSVYFGTPTLQLFRQAVRAQ